MIVTDFDILDHALVQALKADALLFVDADRVWPCSIAFELLQTIGLGSRQVAEGIR